MKQLSLLVLVVLSVVFLALLTPFMLEPERYTIHNESSTSYHSDPATLSAYSDERSRDIQAMMQELLDAPHTIVLNIKIKDFEEAQGEFEEYKEKSRYFNGVVVNLDLEDSAIGDFRRENRKNMETLERMINESARFDEINRLEIRYRTEENPALLYTVALEGEAIQNSLKKSSTQLADREPDIIEIGNGLGLNTTRYQEAVALLSEVVEEDQKQQEERQLNRPALPESTLSLSVSPLSGGYGDTLQVAGTYTFVSAREVTLVLDSRDWKTLAPDQNGVFTTTLPIGRIREGEHSIFATTGALYSNLVTFTVVPTDTVITFGAIQGGEHWSGVSCHGDLHAGEIPVAAAPVRILVDDFEALTLETDMDGYYSGSLNLTEGDHTLQAVFDDAAFPLHRSESPVVRIALTPSVPLRVAIGVGGGILLLASLGLIWYVRRRNPPPGAGELPAPSGPDLTSESPDFPEAMVQPTPPPSLADILIQYQALSDAGDGSGAAALLYRFLIGRIAPLPGVNDPYALTAREMASLLSDTSFIEPFRAFVSRYEMVRYGGMPLQPRDVLLSHWNAVLAVFNAPGGRS
jgi:hypothetical protein